MLFDFWSAIDGSNFLATVGLILLVLYTIFIYNWSKKLMGQTLAIIFTLMIVYFILYIFIWILWVPVILFLIATFGKDVAERIPK
ncbi:MAG: hypothetical protein PHQ98_03275 [Candidatus ainarchaeum sp.]|nr:hypothetical protein [Candidatus ainarchaeum sp.]